MMAESGLRVPSCASLLSGMETRPGQGVEVREGSNTSLPIGLSEFWESEPIGAWTNINSIHDQGCRYHYLDNKRSK